MFLYFYWPKEGGHIIQSFYRADKAAQFTVEMIQDLIGNGVKPNPKKKPPRGHQVGLNAPAHPIVFENIIFPVDPVAVQPVIAQPVLKSKSEDAPIELTTLREHLKAASKAYTLDSAVKAIELYEEYNRYVMGNESAIHTLQEIDIVE